MKKISKKWRLPDEVWEQMEPLLSKKAWKMGRPRLDARQVADGIFYVMRTGCQWKAAPPEFGSGSSLHEYLSSRARGNSAPIKVRRKHSGSRSPRLQSEWE